MGVDGAAGHIGASNPNPQLSFHLYWTVAALEIAFVQWGKTGRELTVTDLRIVEVQPGQWDGTDWGRSAEVGAVSRSVPGLSVRGRFFRGPRPGRPPPQVGADNDVGQDAQPTPDRLPLLDGAHRRCNGLHCLPEYVGLFREHILTRIHRRTGMDGVRTAEGDEGVTGAMIRARIWVDGRLAGGLQALLGAPMAAYSGCGEPDGEIGHGKRCSRTGLARVCGDVGLAGESVADGRRQAGSGMARSRARARLNCSSQGQRRGRCRVNRRAERVIRPAKAKTRRLRVLVVTIC